MQHIKVTLVLLLAAASARAADFDDFLPGAKAMGMGSAFSAVADDPYAMFYNPAGTANTPYAQAGAGLGRLQSPVGTLSEGTLTYLRPFEPINTATLGGAYMSERQTNGGDKDEMLLHYSQELKVPQLFLSKPLKLGGNLKFMAVNDGRHQPSSTLFGLGGDVGAMVRSSFGLNGSLVLQDLVTNVGEHRPKFDLGTSYLYHKWLTAAADLRVRNGLADFYPGLEAAFDEGLLKVRVGRGFQLDGISQFAFGFGVNLSPVTLDVGMQLPTGGIHRQGGGFQASFNYRFGAPSFSGNFVGNAAAQADALKAEVQSLQQRKLAAEQEAATAETHRQIGEAELGVLEQRVRELEDQYRGLNKKKEDAEFGLRESEVEQAARNAPPRELPLIRKPAPPKRPSWPQRHVVKPGETLRSMAKTFYGDGNKWELIYDANKDKVERGLPQEGAEFLIPAP